MDTTNIKFDFDYIIVGSGFGGSVSAMRLSQKGYSVGVIESGRHWNEDEFPGSNLNIRKSFWLPSIGCYGIQRIHLLRNLFIVAASGVGGGSLNYANTLYVPPDRFFNTPAVKRLGGRRDLMPYYRLAQRMLGVTENPAMTEQDVLLREMITETGRGDTFSMTPVGIFFGKKGEPSADPYFYGEGPDRIGCDLCGECMTGCRKNAKNTLDKNYLYFARKFGARIFSMNKVTDVKPLSPDGGGGYIVKTRGTAAFSGKLRGRTFTARGIIFSAGALGTNDLLLKLKKNKSLPNLPEHLGKYARSNSEVIIGASSRSREADYSRGIAITSSIYPDDITHIEPVRYGSGHDAMGLITATLTDGGGHVPRFLKAIWNTVKNPIDFLRELNPLGWARRVIILLVMQTEDNYINLKRKRTFYWPFSPVLTSEYGTERRNPSWLPVANDFARRLAKKINGIPRGVITENLFNAPITAHIMGGCTIGPTPEEGVIDRENHIIGYRNMLVCDGAQIPENLGVNPALSITAFTERAMSFIQPKKGKIRYLAAEKKWGVEKILLRKSVHKKIGS